MNDFRKFATSRGMSGMVLDDVMRAQAQYLNPYILEERQLNVKIGRASCRERV